MSKHSQSKIWYLILLAAMVVWSSNHIVFKLLLNDLSAGTVFLYRYVFASSLLVVLYFLTQRSHPKITKRDVGWLLAGTMFGTVGGGLALLYGIKFSGASVTAILINTNPLFVIIIAVLIGMEKMSWVRLVGILIGITGVVAIIMGGGSVELADATNTFSNHLLGTLIILGGSLCIGLATIVSKHLIHRVSGLVIILFNVLTVSVATCVLFIFVQPELFVIHNPYHWLGLAYVGMVGTGLAWWIYTVSLRHIDASATASFKLVIPIVTTIAAWIWLNERLTTLSIIGMLLTIIGIIIVINHIKLRTS